MSESPVLGTLGRTSSSGDLRQHGWGGRVLLTAGVAALPEAERAAFIAVDPAFDAFSGANDPHGEHDFGMVEVSTRRSFWKIDCYDCHLRFGSQYPPPTPPVTARVLTIILPQEY